MLKIGKRSFTLIELVLVVSLVVILAVIGTSSSGKARNKAVSREAIANLKLIAAAERIYKMENDADAYVACANTVACNNTLNLHLNATNWTYIVNGVSGSGSTAAATVNANGTARGISGCNYTLTSADFDTQDFTTKTGSCP